LVRDGVVTAGELLDAALEQMEKVNPRINAVVLVREQEARRHIAAGLPNGPLRGVPLLLKDLNTPAAGFPSHNGSTLLRNTTYIRNNTLVDRLQAAGLVIFGRTTSPEGGIGAVTEAAVYHAPTRNPYDLSRTPGGSSGGAAAAVASGILPAAHGSDGGGSVRIPASCCGLFGFKPTRARLPYGPFASEGWAGMATAGFLTRSVRDTALLLDITQGTDSGAPYAAPPLKSTFMAALKTPPRPLRIALCDTSFTGARIHPDCAAAVHDAARLLSDMGHTITPAVPLADTTGMMMAWTDIVACGTALAIETAVKSRGRALDPSEIEGVSRGALAHAKTISGTAYLAAISKIHSYGREMAAFFDHFDVLLTPTLAEPPAKIGRFAHNREDYVDYRTGPDGIFAYSPFAAAFNASGQPAASVPLHYNTSGLPIGIHLATRFGEDELLMSLCAALEKARPWFTHRPALH